MFSTMINTLFFTPWLLVSATPVLHNPLRSQLVPTNPALSSVYFPLPSSALLRNMSHLASLPAIRVPPNWSFSIGLSGDTFLPGEGESFSDFNVSVQLGNGNPIPYWLQFQPNFMTLNGGTPTEMQSDIITVIASASATISDSFLLIISPHDLALNGSFKTRNITTDLPFSVVIDDFDRITLDDLPTNASLLHYNTLAFSVNFSLLFDTTTLPSVSWDKATSSLSGTGPRNVGRYTLPVIASASFPDQHLSLPISFTLNVFSSYFNSSWLPAQHVVPGSTFSFDLNPYTLVDARRDSGWILSLNDNSSVPWVVFDPARLSLNGTIPHNVSDNARIVISAHHTDHNTTNSLAFDLVIGNAENNQANKDRFPHITSSKVFRKVLGFSLTAVSVVIIALLSAFIYSKRHRAKKRKSFKAIGVAYSYKEPAIHQTHPRNPIQRVFDNFSLTSSPSLGGRLTTTKAVFDAIRNRLRGERFADSSLLGRNRKEQSPDFFRHEANKPVANRTAHTQRPRKSKIGRPIAILNGSSGLFSDFIANNIARTVSFRQPQEKGLPLDQQRDKPISLPPPAFAQQSRFSKSYPQFSPYSSRYPDEAPRPSNPVLRSASDTSVDDAIPPVPPKLYNGSPSMKAGDFLANKRRATLRNAASTSMGTTAATMSSVELNKVGHNHVKSLRSHSSYYEERARPTANKHARTVRPQFGDSSLEDIKEIEDVSVAVAMDSGLNRYGLKRTNASKQTGSGKHHHSGHGNGARRRKSSDHLLESPDTRTEEYFGSASNESVAAAGQGLKVGTGHAAEQSSNVRSVAVTVPSVYSNDDQANASFPISSYSVAARQPFAFTPNIPKSNTNQATETATATVTLVAKQHNGAELPPWLRFDKSTNEFWGVTPDVKKGNVVNVEIDLWDPRTNVVVAGADVEVQG